MWLNSSISREEVFKKRLTVVFWLCIFIFVIFAIRVIEISVFERGRLLSELAPQVVPSYDILRAERGEIFDRNGIKLATSMLTYELDVNPKVIPREKLSQLVKVLTQSKVIKEQDAGAISNADSYVLVSTEVPQSVKSIIDGLNLSDGVVFVKTYKRVYPYREILAPLIGIVGVDGNGLSGVELSLNDYLKGRNGRAFRSFNFSEPEFLGHPTYILKPENGNSVYLTIDIQIQSKVYELVKKYVKEFDAKSGFAIVTDPNTNEILAMVSYPSFDPEHFTTLCQNLPTTFNYEPGSVLKPLIALAALDEGALKVDEDFYCSGSIKVKDRIIYCWKKHGKEHGLTDILVNSCDVAFAQIGLKLGKEALLKYLKLFGLGERTQCELLGEEKGILPDLKDVGDVEVANMAFGQGIAVTQIQLVSALNSIVNGGRLFTPHIIKRIVGKDNNTIYESRTNLRRVIGTEENIKYIKDALVEVVEKGAPKAKIEGYRIMGKTGTAQKPQPTGGYSHSKLIYSFFGAIPYPEPQVSVIVSINETKVPQYSTTVAAPLFSEIGTFLVKYLRIGK